MRKKTIIKAGDSKRRIKKAMDSISYQELFDNALRKNKGDEHAAAEFVLDIATGGTWAVWEQEKINKSIETILRNYGAEEDADLNRMQAREVRDNPEVGMDRDIDYPSDEPTWQDVDGRW